MPRSICRFAAWYALIVLTFIAAKWAFVLYNGDIYAGIGCADIFGAIWQGLPMDLSMGGYLMIVPGVILTIQEACTREKVNVWCRRILCGYRWLIAFLIVSACIADTVLYSHWGTKLDSTPLFYFFTSPAAAAASTSWGWIFVGLLLSAALVWGLSWTFGYIWTLCDRIPYRWNVKAVWRVVILGVITAALFIPIRGGFTVSTMNISRAYYSQDMRLNHLAINPLFSLMYSLAHQDDFASQFRFFSPEKADALYQRLNEPLPTDKPRIDLTSQTRPDIYILVMESFSAELMPSLGGEDVATNLESIASEGILMTQCYASSFRTDRALPAILSGYPAQPTTSIMKYVNKTDRLPSIARILGQNGYRRMYYYGGDANFTNMQAYLTASGFSPIVSDKDFSRADRQSKWGAHDGVVFDRLMADLKSDKSTTPTFRVLQTSSSHEPFEVPYSGRFSDERLNAFEYADHCLGDFIKSLKSDANRWNRSLIVIVADHWGCHPRNLIDPVRRHHIPLVITGGALRPELRGMHIDRPVSQTDIASTLLAELEIESDDFPFSHDFLDPTSPEYAFFSEPEWVALATSEGVTTINVHTDKSEAVKGTPGSEDADMARAYLQKLYDDLARR